LTFPVKEVIYGKEKMKDKAEAVLLYLNEHLPKHKFFIHVDKGNKLDIICSFSTERIYKCNGLFIYIKKLKRQENLKAGIDSTDFKAWIEFFARELNSQSLSIKDQTKKLHKKIVAKYGKNVVSYVIIDKGKGDWGYSCFNKIGFKHFLILKTVNIMSSIIIIKDFFISILFILLK
jgi:hypothetical protein